MNPPRLLLRLAAGIGLFGALLAGLSCGGGGGGGRGPAGPVGPFNNLLGGTVIPGGTAAELDVTRIRTGSASLVQVPANPGIVPGEAVVWLDEDAPADSLTPFAAALVMPGGPALVTGGPADEKETLAWIEELALRPGVVLAEPNRRRYPGQEVSGFSGPNDPVTIQHSWSFDMIRAEAAWRDTRGAASVVVAVVDSGVGYPGKPHPDLEGQLLPGYDFYDNDASPFDVPGRLAHGTHVAGTIAAIANNSIGVAGIAPGVRILPVRVLGPNGGTDVTVARGVLWAAGFSVTGAPVNPNPARVINMSLGGGSRSSIIANAIRDAYNAGVVVVAAAGNRSGSVGYPAANPEAIAVSALTPSTALAWYSNRGEDVELAAPGGAATVPDQDVWSTAYTPLACTVNCTPGYVNSAGTSMASPHVAAVAALVISANPNLTASEVRAVLTDTAVDLGAPGRDIKYGYGLVDAGAAVARAIVLGGGVPSPAAAVLAARTSEIRLTPTQASATIRLTNLGGGEITITDVEALEVLNGSPVPGPTWISVAVDNEIVTPDADGSIVVTVDPEIAGAVSRQALVVVTSDAGEVRVPVLYFPDAAPDPGDVIVRAVNADTGLVAAETVAEKANGYEYELTELPPGSYYLEAITDLDGDGEAHRPDEWSGTFPTSDRQTVSIAAEEEVRGLDIPLQQLAETIRPGTGGGPAAGVLACLVRSAETGLPIQGARVQIGDGDDEARTDARGLVFFSGATGPRTVTASSDGFDPFTYLDADVATIGFNLEPTRLETENMTDVAVTVSGLFSWEYAIVMAGFGDSATVTADLPEAVLSVRGPAVVTVLVFSSIRGNVAIGHAKVSREVLESGSPAVIVTVADYPDDSTIAVDISGSDPMYADFWVTPGLLGGTSEETLILGIDDRPGFAGVMVSPVLFDLDYLTLPAAVFVFGWDASGERQGLMIFRGTAGSLPGRFLTASIPATPEVTSLTDGASVPEGTVIEFTAAAPRSFGELTLKRPADGYTWKIRFGPSATRVRLPKVGVLSPGAFDLEVSLFTSQAVTYESLENLSPTFREAIAALDVILSGRTSSVTVP